jgi:hypothetical protein
VPTLTLDQAAALLGNQPIGAGAIVSQHLYTLRFDGMITTLSGAVGQHLVEQLEPDTIPTPAPTPLRATPNGRFLAQLASARPDLLRRSTILRAAKQSASDASTISGPVLLSGYAWARTSEWIGSYGDLDLLVSWKYLVATLTPGHEFSLQLVPSLATDVFLHARMLPLETVVTESGTYPNARVCLYLVDFGLSEATDPDGNLLGYFRTYTYGSIAYASDVGPIYSYERELVEVGATPDLGLGDWTTSLKKVTPGPSTVAGR